MTWNVREEISEMFAELTTGFDSSDLELERAGMHICRSWVGRQRVRSHSGEGRGRPRGMIKCEAYAKALQLAAYGLSARKIAQELQVYRGTVDRWIKLATPKASSTTRMATCHPEQKHYVKGLCGACYEKTRPKRTSNK